jgi:hypothetical protein
MAGLGTQAEVASMHEDAQRLGELRDFLAQNANASNRRRVAEIDEELKPIAKRLAELEKSLLPR